jgi:hypothetical protein
MEEPNQSEPPQKYTWPKYVLAGVVLGVVLAIFWMAVLVRRISEQREDMKWPTNANAVSAASTLSATNSPPTTNATQGR